MPFLKIIKLQEKIDVVGDSKNKVSKNKLFRNPNNSNDKGKIPVKVVIKKKLKISGKVKNKKIIS